MNNNRRYVGIDMSKKSMKVAYVKENKKNIIKDFKTTQKGKMSFKKRFTTFITFLILSIDSAYAFFI